MYSSRSGRVPQTFGGQLLVLLEQPQEWVVAEGVPEGFDLHAHAELICGMEWTTGIRATSAAFFRAPPVGLYG